MEAVAGRGKAECANVGGVLRPRPLPVFCLVPVRTHMREVLLLASEPKAEQAGVPPHGPRAHTVTPSPEHAQRGGVHEPGSSCLCLKSGAAGMRIRGSLRCGLLEERQQPGPRGGGDAPAGAEKRVKPAPETHAPNPILTSQERGSLLLSIQVPSHRPASAAALCVWRHLILVSSLHRSALTGSAVSQDPIPSSP